LGGGERRFEPRDLFAVVALELGQLGGERPHDVALRPRLVGQLGIATLGRSALPVSTEMLNAGRSGVAV